MYYEHKPWEWVAEKVGDGYVLTLADEETRQKQLEEYKNKRRTELEKEMSDLDKLY